MRLLLTRAEPEAQASAARLRQREHEVLVAPMLEIALLPPPENVPLPDAIALTSVNAVRALTGWPAAPRWKDRRVFAVGDATAEAARAAGFTQIESAKGGSIELAALIGRTLSPGFGPILYPTAETPAGDLAGALRHAGFAVHQVTAYRTTPLTRFPPPVRDAIKERELEAILFYSERGAAAFVDLAARESLGTALAGVSLFALSVQTAGPLRALPSAAVTIAAEPTEASLFAVLAKAD